MRVTGLTRAMKRLSVAAALICAAFAQGALAQEKLEPLADGFPNKPLVVMVVDEPGSSDSLYATHLVEAANKFSPVPINIEHRQDFSSFGTWEAIAWVMDQGELGNEGYILIVYTLPGAVIDLTVIDMESEIGLGLDDLNNVIGTEQIPFVLHQRSDAPWGDTLEDLIKYGKENPKTIRHISGGPGSGLDAAMQVWIRELGFTVNDIIGGGTGERALAVAAGEGDVTVSPIDTLLPHYQAGRVTPLMLSGSNPAPKEFEGVPSAAEAGIEDDPFDQARALAVSPEVSDEHREWLRELFARAAQDETYLSKRRGLPGVTPVILESEELREIGQRAYDRTLPVMKEIGAYWGDQ